MLYFIPDIGKKSILELFNDHGLFCRIRQESAGAFFSLLRSDLASYPSRSESSTSRMSFLCEQEIREGRAIGAPRVEVAVEAADIMALLQKQWHKHGAYVPVRSGDQDAHVFSFLRSDLTGLECFLLEWMSSSSRNRSNVNCYLSGWRIGWEESLLDSDSGAILFNHISLQNE